MNREFLGYDANGQELYEGDMAKPIGGTSYSETLMVVRSVRDDEQHIVENAPDLLKKLSAGFVMVKPVNGWPEISDTGKRVIEAFVGKERAESYTLPTEAVWLVNMLERVNSVEGSVH